MSTSAFVRQPKRAKPKRRKGLEFLYLFGAAVILVVPMLLVASKRSSLVNIGYRMTELRHETAKLQEEQGKLRAEIASLTRPNLVMEQALAMGLKPVPKSRSLQVEIRTDNPLPTKPKPETLVARLEPEQALLETHR